MIRNRTFWTATMLAATGACMAGCGSGSGATATPETGNTRNASHISNAWKEIELDLPEGQIVAKHSGAGHVEATSGKISWPAVACKLEDCTGRGLNGEPFVFPYKIPGARVDTNGQIVWTNGGGGRAKCPACGRSQGVGHYDAPEVGLRKAELSAELVRARAAFKDAARQGEPAPTTHRTPQEILDEIDNLPRVFIVSE